MQGRSKALLGTVAGAVAVAAVVAGFYALGDSRPSYAATVTLRPAEAPRPEPGISLLPCHAAPFAALTLASSPHAVLVAATAADMPVAQLESRLRTDVTHGALIEITVSASSREAADDAATALARVVTSGTDGHYVRSSTSAHLGDLSYC